jgi:hypothetical protein
MSEDKKPKLRPVFENLETALKTWWKHLIKFVRIYLWGLLFTLAPIMIFLIVLGLGFLTRLEQTLPFLIIGGFIGIWALIFAIYFAVRTYISLFILVKKEYSGKELEIYKESKDYFWSYLALVALTFILMMLWFLALIIPAIIYSIFYAFAVYAFMFEGKRDISAVKRSQELVTGYWWAVFGRFLFIGLILWIFMMIISIPLNFVPETSLFAIVWTAFIQIVNYLVGPICMLFTYQIYQDLVKIKK